MQIWSVCLGTTTLILDTWLLIYRRLLKMLGGNPRKSFKVLEKATSLAKDTDSNHAVPLSTKAGKGFSYRF